MDHTVTSIRHTESCIGSLGVFTNFELLKVVIIRYVVQFTAVRYNLITNEK
jgi:hypothetical protein